MSSTFLLPPELLVVVLDFVARNDGGGRGAILKCALVSRLWCTISGPYIFRTIEIALSKDETREWADRCRESPHLVPFISHLTLIGHRWPEDSEDSDESDSYDGGVWEVEDAEELGREMAHVQSLTLKMLAGNSEIEDLAPHLAFLKQVGSAAGGIQSIQLDNVNFERPEHLFIYLSSIVGKPSKLSLKSAGALSFDGYTDVYRNDGHVDHPGTTQLAWSLRSLVLHNTELRRDVLLWLLSSAVDLSGLQSLVLAAIWGEIGISDYDEYIAPAVPESLFERLMVACGSSLQHLTLGSYRQRAVGFPPSQLRYLRHLHELKQIVLISGVSGRRVGLSHTKALSQAIALLPGIQGHPALEEIVLAFDIDLATAPDTEELQSLEEWKILDKEMDALADSVSTFRRLFLLLEITSIYSEMAQSRDSRNASSDMVVNIIRGAMPRSSARGLLAVRAERSWSGNRVKLLYHQWAFDHELLI
ncbi:hypothetical protein AAF712_004620 [Marasmius tenuissimus]|uniref:F-box domain-containing protein n=1 Tax=Marasmius tenuissimus TaxID=585030 RepID=A0ABR3A2P8_9AGAR